MAWAGTMLASCPATSWTIMGLMPPPTRPRTALYSQENLQPLMWRSTLPKATLTGVSRMMWGRPEPSLTTLQQVFFLGFLGGSRKNKSPCSRIVCAGR